jgi:2-hydroxy-3-oxopropionate reductase
MKVGFVGLGIMGKPMAKNLLKGGYPVVVYDHKLSAIREVEAAGAEGASSCREVGEKAEAVITMLPNSPHVKQAVFGPLGVLEGARPGSILVDMSSISLTATREIAARAAEHRVEMLDAPVSGGEPKAVEGTLSIMVGGKREVFERCEEVFGKMGSSVVYCGELGAGTTTKLVNQVIVAGTLAAISEGLVLGTKAGVDPETIYRAIRGGLAGSALLDAKVPMILDGNFKPGFRIELHRKDLANALETAHDVGVPLPFTSQVAEVFQALQVDGKGADDHSGIIRFFEKLAHREVRR